MSEESRTKLDRMRYTPNTISSRLALLSILLNVFFFISIYGINVVIPTKITYTNDYSGKYYYWLIGASILYNLIFMLAAFLSSEGSKKYISKYSILMFILGAGQIIRIFIYPAKMHVTEYTDPVPVIKGDKIAGSENVIKLLMPTDQYVRAIIYLSLSAACLIAAAAINLAKSRMLAAHEASLNPKQAVKEA